MSEFMDPATLLPLVAALAIAGALIGFLAGLFGIGGGAISVPVFYEVFQTLGHAPEVAMPMAVGTSLAVIIPTSIRSFQAAGRPLVPMASLEANALGCDYKNLKADNPKFELATISSRNSDRESPARS